jgi:hypothetical protein
MMGHREVALRFSDGGVHMVSTNDPQRSSLEVLTSKNLVDLTINKPTVPVAPVRTVLSDLYP